MADNLRFDENVNVGVGKVRMESSELCRCINPTNVRYNSHIQLQLIPQKSPESQKPKYDTLS